MTSRTVTTANINAGGAAAGPAPLAAPDDSRLPFGAFLGAPPFSAISIYCAAIRIWTSDTLPAIWRFILRIKNGSIDLSMAACCRS